MRTLLLVAIASCSLDVSYTGTNYQCNPDGSCPPNFICESKVCVPVPEAPPACSKAVAAGDSHACAVRNDGTVWCWGRNDFGQLGDGTVTDRLTPVQVQMITGAIAVAAGGVSSCALLKSGDAWCWGHNDVGQLGDGTNTDSKQPVQVKNVSGATKLAVGAEHACALLADGSMPCWGSNDHGELGDGTHTNRSMAMPVNVPTAISIAAGDDFTCAVDSMGTVRCWGENDLGETGNGMDGADVTMPSAVMIMSPLVGVAAGGGFACANDAAGAVWCWGDNSDGQVGNGTQGNQQDSPQQVDNAVGLHDLVAGGNHACGLDDYRHMWCWGYDADGRLADGNPTSYRPVPTMSEIQDVVAITAGGEHSCAVDSKGGIRCAGFDRRGDLGDGLRTTQGVPQQVPGITGAVSIAAGDSHTCVALMDGSARCWGNNGNGQLGNGTTFDSAYPTTVIGIGNVTKMVAGGDHTCAISDGLVMCWGDNSSGQVGAGDFDSPVPQFVSQLGGYKVDEIVAGGTASCVLRNGQAMCWGNQYGGPMAVVAQGYSDVVHVALGSLHTCVLRSGGEVDCWGSNYEGQLGNGGTGSPTNTPQLVGNLSSVAGLSLGGDGSCAIAMDGTAKCWGYDGSGNLGNGVAPYAQVTASSVQNLTGAAELAKGADASCARKGDGSVWCFGPGYVGEIGDSQYATREMATQVPGLNVMHVAAGGSHICAILGDGTVSCWGLDTNGQLGDGIHASQHAVGVQMTCPQ
jgi:alpha-tubulin suppressor-like RCC1 family protein